MFKLAQHWTVEENIEGSFLKYNTPAGEICTDEEKTIVFEIANAFSHWTWKQSNRTMMALDMQGVGSTFTDCALASIAKKFGFDYLGPEAIQKFFDFPVLTKGVKPHFPFFPNYRKRQTLNSLH
jgi:hypothetical protein